MFLKFSKCYYGCLDFYYSFSNKKTTLSKQITWLNSKLIIFLITKTATSYKLARALELSGTTNRKNYLVVSFIISFM